MRLEIVLNIFFVHISDVYVVFWLFVITYLLSIVIVDQMFIFSLQAGQAVISGHRAGFEKLAETLQW